MESGLTLLLSAIGAGALAAYVAILGVKVALCRLYSARGEQCADEGDVMVIQPILSGDVFLEEALRRNLKQSPTWARFLWLIDEDDAEARRVTTRLAADSAGRADILVCPPPAGNVNPKTFKLNRALSVIETPFVAVLDDDTVLADHNLEKGIVALETCELYAGLPCYLPGTDFWSSLVSHFVNNNSILTYLPLQPLVGALTINGMFYVMRTQTLKKLGGFTPILDRLCDDYALAGLLKAHGGTIRQSATPVLLRTTVQGPRHYFRIMHRWFVFANILVCDQPAGVVTLLFVFLGLPPFLLWLGLLSLLGGWPLILVLPAVLILRHLALRHLHRVVFGGLPHFGWAMSILAELLQPLHWIHACLRHTVIWRTRRVRVHRAGTFSYLPRQGP